MVHDVDVDDIEHLLAELEGHGVTRQGAVFTTASPSSGGAGMSEGRNAVGLADFSTYAAPPPASTAAGGSLERYGPTSVYSEGPRVHGRLAPLATTAPAAQQHRPLLWSSHNTTLGGAVPAAADAESVRKAADALLHQGQSPATDDGDRNAQIGLAGHIVNFLPVMHTRYLDDTSGITPRPRWGHSFTAIHDSVFLFGGTVVPSGDASNDLFSFHPKANEWEPCLSVNRGCAPTPRYQHAAAVVDGGRFLVVYGGRSNHGSSALGDMLAYDLVTQEWSPWYVPPPPSSSSPGDVPNKNEPYSIYGHTMVCYKQRLFVFGGRVGRGGDTAGGVLSNDVYIFHWPSRQWKKRVHIASKGKHHPTADDENEKAADGAADHKDDAIAAVPQKRMHHAACVLGDWMIVHGGEPTASPSASTASLADVWAFHFSAKCWSQLHGGWTGDSAPRSRHTLLSSGEAVLAIGGCTRASATSLAQRVDCFLSVLPVAAAPPQATDAAPLIATTGVWSPVVLGNSSCAPPSLRFFGASMVDGFLYVFGGVPSETMPATNHLIRCLATDGVPLAEELLSSHMRKLVFRAGPAGHHHHRGASQADSPAKQREHASLDDITAFPYNWHCDLALEVGDKGKAYVHRALIAQRAPSFFNDLMSCRSEEGVDYGAIQLSGGTAVVHRVAFDPPTILIDGNSRVKGLRVPLNMSHLAAFLNWIYTGGFDAASVGSLAPVLRQLGLAYNLPEMLEDLTSAVDDKQPSSSATATRPVGGSCMLGMSMRQLLSTPKSCNATILFVDPHTGQEMTHPAHTWVLANSCSVFAQLLRPLWTTVDGLRMQEINTLDGITAKVAHGKRVLPIISGGTGATSYRRSVVIGPVRIPLLSVKPILSFLYTFEMNSVTRDIALQVLIGATTLHLTSLQRYCEAIVAREEVNFDSCCHYITLAKSYRAQLLEEMSLVTAAVGYHDEVRRSAGFSNLPAEDQQTIEKIAGEVRGLWSAPAAAKTEQKSPEVYAARFSAQRLE